MMKRLNLVHPAFILALASLVAPVCTARAQGLEQSAIEQQQGAIQAEITQGITNGTLSAAQVVTLQSQLQQLQQASALGAGQTPASTAQNAGLGRVGQGLGETPVPLNGVAGNGQFNRATGQAVAPVATPNPAPNQTGPDPFTYNTLGPDAYQSQKYQAPAYNVPAYPTTNPQAEGTQQQYSAPSAGTPYGAGYGQAPGAGGALPQVYVYHPSMSR